MRFKHDAIVEMARSNSVRRGARVGRRPARLRYGFGDMTKGAACLHTRHEETR